MKKLVKTIAIIALSLGLGACFANKSESSNKTNEMPVKIGVVGDDQREWDKVSETLKAEGITIELIKFDNYTLPNEALAKGDIDLNSFQHQAYLDNYNKEFGTDLVKIGNTIIAPLAVYSEKIKDIKALKEGATVAIPNDVTNGGRALILLQSAGFIEVDKKAGITPTLSDITSNKLNLKIQEVDASQTARALADVDIAVINSGYAVDAGLVPAKDAIFSEPVDENSKPYVNIIAARAKDANNEVYNKIVDAYQQEATAKIIQEKSKGANVAAWKEFGRK